MTNQWKTRDEDARKGALEQDRLGQKTNTSLAGQIGHRDQDPLVKSSDSDFPEPGNNEDHTGEPSGENQLVRDTEVGAEKVANEQSPGAGQKENQNKT